MSPGRGGGLVRRVVEREEKKTILHRPSPNKERGNTEGRGK